MFYTSSELCILDISIAFQAFFCVSLTNKQILRMHIKDCDFKVSICSEKLAQ